MTNGLVPGSFRVTDENGKDVTPFFDCDWRTGEVRQKSWVKTISPVTVTFTTDTSKIPTQFEGTIPCKNKPGKPKLNPLLSSLLSRLNSI